MFVFETISNTLEDIIRGQGQFLRIVEFLTIDIIARHGDCGNVMRGVNLDEVNASTISKHKGITRPRPFTSATFSFGYLIAAIIAHQAAPVLAFREIHDQRLYRPPNVVLKSK